jgi:DNA-binding SARP family transcriptional activator
MSAFERCLDARICAVVAPAGAGKTTALAQWANRTPVDVAWFRAGQDPPDPGSALLDGLGAAVHAADPQLPRASDWDALAEVCTRRDSPLVLVVDDLHHLASQEVGGALERLLLTTDDQLHLVVSSRTPPPLNMARTELASAVLGPADLGFRPAETAELFRDCYGLPLSDPDARTLTRRTGGWAAALHLFRNAVASRAPEVRHRSVRALGQHDNYAREYLAQTILAGLAPDELAFLRSTAALDTLTGDLCDSLLGVKNSQDYLTDLSRRGVVVAADTGPGFCTPEVLRTHLLAEMRDDLGDAKTDDWLCATAALLAREAVVNGAAAVRTYVAGRNWPAALTVVAEQWGSVIGDPDLDWIDLIPGEFGGREVQVARAVRARRDGSLEAAASLAQVEGAAGTDPVSESARAIIRFCRMWGVGDLQPGEHWSDYLRAALRRPNPDRRTALPSVHADVLRAFELTVAGGWSDARRLLSGCPERLEDDPATSCAVDLLAAVLQPADPEHADAIAARAEELGLPWFARIATGLAYGRRGASGALAAAVRAAEDRGDRWGAMLMAGTAAIVQLRAGVPATRAFEDLVRRCRELDAPALEAWARCGAALSSAAAHLPDSSRDAESAIGFAHSAQVPGALAVAYAAAALDRSDHEMRHLAEDEAARTGLDVRPWEWLDPRAAEDASPAVVVDRPPPLEVRCFGGFELFVGGTAPCLTRVRPRARALLRLLSLYAGQPVHREVIVDAMWPQLDVSAATHNLHVCVSGLRSALEPGVPRGASQLIVRDGERYLLALPEGAISDLRTFDARTVAAERARNAGEADTAIADLEVALRLYTGDVLPEDGPTEWVLAHREHYKVRAAEAAAMLGRLHLDHGRPEHAAAAARSSIDVDPCRDASWRLLVAAHKAAGDLAASEEARRSYADVLTSLGVASNAATAIRSRG